MAEDLQSTRVVYCEQDVRFYQTRTAQPAPETPTTPGASSAAAVLSVPSATTNPTIKKYDRYHALREHARIRNLKRAVLAQLKPTPITSDLPYVPVFKRLRKTTRRRPTEPTRGLRLLEMEELCRRGERPATKKIHCTWSTQYLTNKKTKKKTLKTPTKI